MTSTGLAAHVRAMPERCSTTVTTMLYPELFRSLEAVRWNMEKDIP
ncbi:hypothetical protein FOZ70_36695, partial [Burkholderia sp. COPS]|nr:hypothetical protein [Burkholderia sp. COPS]